MHRTAINLLLIDKVRYSSAMKITGMEVLNRKFVICFVVVAISVTTVLFGDAAASSSSGNSEPTTQGKLPAKEFTHPAGEAARPNRTLFQA